MSGARSKVNNRNIHIIIVLWRCEERDCIPETSTGCHGNRLIRAEERAPGNLKHE